MLLTKTIQKAEKLSNQNITQKGQFYSVPYKGYTIQFACNGRNEPTAESTNFYTLKDGAKDDLMTDYFAGTFHDNITQAFKFVDRITAPEIATPINKNYWAEKYPALISLKETFDDQKEYWSRVQAETGIQF